MITEVSQNEYNENGNIDTLDNEIESWKDFRYALREEDTILFNEMLSEYGQNKDYIRATVSRGENYSAESLFILLIFQHEKMIKELVAKVSQYKKLQKQT